MFCKVSIGEGAYSIFARVVFCYYTLAGYKIKTGYWCKLYLYIGCQVIVSVMLPVVVGSKIRILIPGVVKPVGIGEFISSPVFILCNIYIRGDVEQVHIHASGD